MKKVHFIDCGANVGNAIDWAKKEYEERLVKVDAFEPEYLNYLSILKKFSSDSLFDLTVHAQAVWIKNEIKKFYIQSWGTRTGSSLLVEKAHIIGKGQVVPYTYKGKKHYLTFNESSINRQENGMLALNDLTVLYTDSPEIVQCLNLSDWIFKNLSKENYNVLKVDIEGAEYKVIDHLLNTGAHELIDLWLVEFTSKGRVPESFNQSVIDRFKSTISPHNYIDWGPMGETIMGKV